MEADVVLFVVGLVLSLATAAFQLQTQKEKEELDQKKATELEEKLAPDIELTNETPRIEMTDSPPVTAEVVTEVPEDIQKKTDKLWVQGITATGWGASISAYGFALLESSWWKTGLILIGAGLLVVGATKFYRWFQLWWPWRKVRRSSRRNMLQRAP